MPDSTTRLLRVLALLQARATLTGDELARELGVTTRTIRTDVERLRDLGYRVDATRGVAGGYRLAAGNAIPPLLLDPDEAVAVAVGLRSAASGSVRGIESAAVRALVKLERLLPARSRGALASLRDETRIADDGPDVDADVLQAVADAVHAHRTLRFSYRSRADEATRRHVEPHELAFVGYRWYLLAWDLERADWRTFRLDRLTPDRQPHGRPFPPRRVPGGDAIAYVRAGVVAATRIVGTVRCRTAAAAADVADAVAERLRSAGLSDVAVRADGEGAVIVDLSAGSLAELVVGLGAFPGPVEVLGPPELVRAAADLRLRLLEA